MRRALLLLLVALAPGALPWPALAGAIRDCSTPVVYSGADVNVVILPYAPTREGSPLAPTFEKLGLLMKLHTLFRGLGYRNLGVTFLVGDPGDCDPERVTRQLLSGSSGAVRPGHGLVVLWGRLYERGERIYVQSTVRFLRRGVDPEKVEVSFSTAGGPQTLDAVVPAGTLVFPPRRFTQRDLEGVEAAFVRDAVVRERPDPTAPGHPLSIEPGEPFAFGVSRVEGEWMHVEPQRGGPSGWVHADLATTGIDLSRLLPELEFVNAAIGYLRYRVATETRQAPVDAVLGRTPSLVEQAVKRFDAAAGSEHGFDDARATIRALLASLLLLSDQAAPDRAAAEQAERWAGEAAELQPYSPEARSLFALASFALCCSQGRAGSPDVAAQELKQVLAYDPKNLDALGALQRIYGYQASRDASASSRYEERAAEVQRVYDAVRPQAPVLVP